MKKNLSVFLILVCYFVVNSCTNTVEDAITYNESIVYNYEKVADIEDQLMFFVLTNDTLRYKGAYQNFINRIDSAALELEGIGSFGDDSSFFMAAWSMNRVYKDFAIEKIDFINSFSNNLVYGSDSLNPEGELILEKHIKELDSVIDVQFDKFDMAQQKFAARHSFKLMDN